MNFKRLLVGAIFFATILLVGGGVQSMAFADDEEFEAEGEGEAVAQEFVVYDSGEIPSSCNVSAADADAMGVDPAVFTGDCTVGHPFTFGFKAEADDDGEVEGEMFISDPTLGLVIESTVDLLVADPRIRAGLTGSSARLNGTGTAAEKAEKVFVNGRLLAGWNFVNAPTFNSSEDNDGGRDTVCFELFNAGGDKILQWSSIVTQGDVEIEED